MTQGRGYTSKGGHLEESISVGRLHSTARTLSLIRGWAICDLAHYLVIIFVPSTFYLPFSLKRVNLRPTRVSWYQLDCAFRYIKVTCGFVPSVVGRAVGLDASYVEASSHFHNIGKDSPKKCACMNHGEKGNWFRLSFAWEIMGKHPIPADFIPLKDCFHLNTASPCSALFSMSREKHFLELSIFPMLHVSKSYLNCDP